MGDNNYLSAYKLINSQLVLSNGKLKEEIKDKIEMINELNEQLFQYREENKTLRDMVQKLLEQFKTLTTIMISVRDQSESVFNVVHNKHAAKEYEQSMRRPIAGIIYEKRLPKDPPYVYEAQIHEGEDEDQSMDDYRPAVSLEENDEQNDVPEAAQLLQSPTFKRISRKSRSRTFDESFETIDTNRVVKVARKSQEYLQGRESRESRASDGGSVTEVEYMNISDTVCPDVENIPDDSIQQEDELKVHSVLEASSFSSETPSDHSTQSDCVPTTDRSLRSTSMKRIASDSMLVTLVEREGNKTLITANDTIANATCSTPLAKGKRSNGNRLKLPIQHMSPMSPVPVVFLKPLTKENLDYHNVSFGSLLNKENIKEEHFDKSEQSSSIGSNESRRPRRKAAPKVLTEHKLNKKMRRT